MEEAGPGKKLVRREVVRVITPGTATGLNVIEPRENNFLAAVARGCGEWSFDAGCRWRGWSC